MKYGIRFISSLFCEYIYLEYVDLSMDAGGARTVAFEDVANEVGLTLVLQVYAIYVSIYLSIYLYPG